MDRREFVKYLLSGMVYLSISPILLAKNNNSLEEKIYHAYNEVREKFEVGLEPVLVIDGESQILYEVYEDEEFRINKSYDISTSKYGLGNEKKSDKTPTGIHKIAFKYGHQFKLGHIFSGKNRWKTIEINPSGKGKVEMTGRFMRLRGCEKKNLNTWARDISIHGVSSEGLIGTPASHGCIRMRNKDVIELYDMVDIGTYVNIKEKLT